MIHNKNSFIHIKTQNINPTNRHSNQPKTLYHQPVLWSVQQAPLIQKPNKISPPIEKPEIENHIKKSNSINLTQKFTTDQTAQIYFIYSTNPAN